MNRLSTEKRGNIVGLLTEGMSMRAISRVTGVARNTIDKLLVDLGTACAEYQDGALQNLATTRVECDEIWSFTYAKQKNVPDEFRDTPGYGDEDLTLTSDPPMLYVSNPKGSSFGHVPLHPDIVVALEAWGLPPSGYVFPGWKGRRFIDPGTVSGLGSAHLRSLGIKATMHQLRHRLGTVLYRESKDIRLTQRVLRHASLQSTQVYVASDVEAMGGFFSGI